MRSAAALVALAAALPALAEVTVTGAWVRATVPAQKTTAAYLTLRSTAPARVVEVRSSVAGRAEIHATEMKHGVMEMRGVEGLELAPGKTVELKPGGYHLMLMELKKPLEPGERVPLAIVVDEGGGKRSTVEATAEVRGIGP